MGVNIWEGSKAEQVASALEAIARNGSSGTLDYDELVDKPQIAGVELSGNKTLHDLGIASEADAGAKYTKPAGGIPAADLASGVLTSIIDDTSGVGDTGKTWSADLTAKKDTYVTPEQFGAVGDGTTDDTTAIQNCINYANTNKVSVRGYKRYKTTSTLRINANYFDIEMTRITYTGNSYALSVSGNYNNIKINLLYCSTGYGLLMLRATANDSCAWNRINIGRIYSLYDSVTFDTTGGWILYNTLDIRFLQSDNGNCYNGPGTGAVENVFLNTTCSCPNGWAIYRLSGRFYNFTLEGDVFGGLYNTTGYCAGFRVRELVDKVVTRINGTRPDVTGGTLVKIVGKVNGTFIFSCEDAIPYAAIDVSEAMSVDDTEEIASPDIGASATSFAFYKYIDAPIRYGNWDTGTTESNGYVLTGKGMILVGDRKICIPAYETIESITDADYDMRDAQVLLDNARDYPTKFVINVDNCVIHLSPSYCAYGYSEFVVDQTKGHLCTIYDANSDSTPIFNGATYGAGIYKFKAYCDIQDNVIKDIRTSQGYGGGPSLNDGTNFIWDITRIDSGSNAVYVRDFGAVGDGTTDDSAAIQAACDSGYEVRFDDDKTYYLASTVTVNHDIHLAGGKGTKIKTTMPSGGSAYDGIAISGTLKKTTTLTSDYTADGNTANCNNKFTLTDMSGIEIGDIMVIEATDQYYNYARDYYWLGASLLITDIYDGHIYSCDEMPWNITNTANVSVKIYSAPSVIVENITFESSGFDGGHYKYLMYISKCKNSTIRDCTFTKMNNGICVGNSVNVNISNLSLSKSKYDNSLSGDGYGIAIYSCTNTTIERVLATCAQHAITLSGQIPSLNTYIRNCNLTSECRTPGLDTHESTYNLVVEDCVLGTAALNGTVHLNRCRIINNRRPSAAMQISAYGSQNPEWSSIVIENTTFDGSGGIAILEPVTQNPVQAYDNVFGDIRIENCTGGTLYAMPATSATVLSNTIQNLTIKNWKNCDYIYVTGTWRGKRLSIEDSTFKSARFITDRNASHGIRYDYFDYVDVKNTHPASHKISVCRDTYGENVVLPEGVPITVSSNSQSAKYIICGTNVVSDNIDDYCVGMVSGSSGGDLTRTIAPVAYAPTIAFNGNGDLVFTQLENNTSNYCVYPVGLVYVKEPCSVSLSCTLKNTGSTSGATFRPAIATVDCSTGKLVDRLYGTAKTASAVGESASYEQTIMPDHAVLCYYYCSTAVSGAETTFEDYSVNITPLYAPPVVPSEFTANRRTGDGTILSLPGVNNIMCSETNFHVSFSADLSESHQDISGKADKTGTVLATTLSRGRKANTTVGEGSIAFGSDVEASDGYAVALGQGTIANHALQYVFGRHNVQDPSTNPAGSVGTYAEIVGCGTSSSKKNARALDWLGNEYLRGKLYVECDNSSANGSEVAKVNNPSFTNSVSMNRAQNSTVGTNSAAFGSDVIASGNQSFAEGTGGTFTVTVKSVDPQDDITIIETDETYTSGATGSSAHSEGYKTHAAGNWGSHSEGNQTVALGAYSHAEGFNTIAGASYAHAEGNRSQAANSASHAEGSWTFAYGGGSHAEGTGCIVYGESAHAEGLYCVAVMEATHAEGAFTIANTSYLHACGSCNAEAPSYNEWVPNTHYVPGNRVVRDYIGWECVTENTDSHFTRSNWKQLPAEGPWALVIGNGVDQDHRSNAAMVTWDGDILLAGKAFVGVNSDGTGGTRLATVNDIPEGLPSYSSANEGYVLKIVNGTPTWVAS